MSSVRIPRLRLRLLKGSAQRTVIPLLPIAALAVLTALALLPLERGGLLARFLPGIRLGLDLRGGTQLTYEADTQAVPESQRGEALEGVRDVIERRVNAFGVAEPLIQIIRGKSRVLVELAGFQDVEEAVKQIGETPQLDFREEGEPIKAQDPVGGDLEIPQWKRTDLTGRQLRRAEVLFHPQTGEPQISLQFDEEGKDRFAELTKRNVGRSIAIFLDGEPITAPVVQEEIRAGEAVITGRFTIAEAKQLARRLNAGALPVPISLVSRTTIGPSLGQESLTESLVAATVGLLALVLVMVVLYRLPGFLAVLALLLYGELVLGILAVLGTTLTLAGIAGFVLSLGMAVDANILIFERVKEELRSGKALPRAITEGFREAWPSIRDSNVASLITAGLLYTFGSSVVRGFATTLAVGIVVSIFTAVTVTRGLLRVTSTLRSLSRLWWYTKVSLPDRETKGWLSALLSRTRVTMGLSALLVVASLFALVQTGFRPGIDFTGGTLWELRGEGVSVSSVREVLTASGEPGAVVQSTGGGTVLARLRPLSVEEHRDLLVKLKAQSAKLEEVRFETIGPTIGRELLRQAVLAVVFALVLILTYLAWAFRKTTVTVSPWAFGLIAIIAVAHDLLIMTGFHTLLVRYHGATADSLFLTAVLTLLGFSVHDTIVVFNRVKTNLRQIRMDFRSLVERSVVETFTRSVNTSATTLLVLLSLLFFGGTTTRTFVATLSIGIVVGTYSSIFLASPLLVWWQSRLSKAR